MFLHPYQVPKLLLEVYSTVRVEMYYRKLCIE